MRLAVRTVQTGAVLALILSLAFSEALASGVGASLYVQGKSRPAAQPTVQQASCQTPVSGCSGCQRLGFACVDHATPPPCTAEGGCYPNRPTFGFTQARWRRWPGAKYGSDGPQVAEPGGALPSVDEPSPEDEDKQAPPSIEDAESPSEPSAEDPTNPGFDEEEGPGIEVTLPPLPEGPLPTPRPNAPQFQNAPLQNKPLQNKPLQNKPLQNKPQFQNNAPPALPFGFDNRSTTPSQDEWQAQPAPFTTVPANLPKPTAGDDAPPPLPRGFTSTGPQQLLRRLPVTRPVIRYDGQIRQASAEAAAR